MKLIYKLNGKIILLYIIFILFCSSVKSQEVIPLTLKQTIENLNILGFELYGKYTVEDRNLCFSPYFFMNSMSMLYMGAKGGTARQMHVALRFDKEQKSHFDNYMKMKYIIDSKNSLSNQFIYLNKIWLNKRYKPLYLYDKYSNKYEKEPLRTIELDKDIYKAQSEIDQWVTYGSDKKIPKLFNNYQLQDSSIMILTSLCHFKGAFQSSFGKKVSAPFIKDEYGRKTRSIDYLTHVDYFKYAETSEFQIIEIPYKDDSLSMVVILPKSYEHISKFEKKMNYQNYKFWMSTLYSEQVKVFLPVVTISSNYYLKKRFEKLMPVAFIIGANFTRIVGDYIYISDIIHSASIAIDEPESVITTDIEVDKNEDDIVVFNANKPFVYIVKENKNDIVLFIGHVVNPNPK